MSDCCSPRGYRRIFSADSARAQARRYRRSGLDRNSRRVAEVVLAHGVEGLTLLEVGGGVGAIQLELLHAGMRAATSVELTPTYEASAAELLEEAGLRERVERRVADFVQAQASVPAADVVVMNRVVCCYPDMPALVGAAGAHARRLMVLSFPREALWTRAAVSLVNLLLWVTRREFHIFVHPVSGIAAEASLQGLTADLGRPGLFWQTATFSRGAASS
ncbi:MAG: class I SAM-dependent methyltransferase [Candidatus Dormibacteria bacterium]